MLWQLSWGLMGCGVFELYMLVAISGGITSTIVTFEPIRKALNIHWWSLVLWPIIASAIFPFIIHYILSTKENTELFDYVTKKDK